MASSSSASQQRASNFAATLWPLKVFSHIGRTQQNWCLGQSHQVTRIEPQRKKNFCRQLESIFSEDNSKTAFGSFSFKWVFILFHLFLTWWLQIESRNARNLSRDMQRNVLGEWKKLNWICIHPRHRHLPLSSLSLPLSRVRPLRIGN